MNKFTDVPLGENQAYFIIAAPSTWPPFAAKMDELLSLLDKFNHIKVVMIYLAEAHADDVWPLGYGINSAKSVTERKSRCQTMLDKFPKLESKLDAIFVDNMSNDFILKTGAWPEAYFFADKNGTALWKSVIEDNGT